MRPATRVFLIVTGLSSAGSGLIHPLAAIYLNRGRHFDLWVASVYFVAVAGGGLAVSLLAGATVDRLGARLVAVAGTAAEGVGMCLLGVATHPAFAVAAGLLIGLGNGAFFTALTPLLARLESGPALDRAFALRYWSLNLGGGLGLLGGGSVIAAVGESAYGPLFVANGLTSLVFAAVIAVAVPTRGLPPAAAEPTGLRRLLADRRLTVLLAAQAVTVAFGIALFESVVPAVVVLGGGESGALANAIVLSSVVVIVVAQLPVSRWTGRRRRTTALTWQALIWAAGAAAMLVTAGHGRAPTWLAIGYGALFGLGECLYAAAFGSLVTRVVPAELQGRYNGVLSLTFGIGLTVGPPVGLWIFSRSAGAFWAASALACLLAALLWRGVAPLEEQPVPLRPALEVG
jgi:MFS family permease